MSARIMVVGDEPDTVETKDHPVVIHAEKTHPHDKMINRPVRGFDECTTMPFGHETLIDGIKNHLIEARVIWTTK